MEVFDIIVIGWSIYWATRILLDFLVRRMKKKAIVANPALPPVCVDCGWQHAGRASHDDGKPHPEGRFLCNHSKGMSDYDSVQGRQFWWTCNYMRKHGCGKAGKYFIRNDNLPSPKYYWECV